MYFRGKLTVDPHQLTKIRIVKPESSFRQIFFHLTGGRMGDKNEVETFKALSLIQQLYSTFSNIGIDNIIRLNHNDLEIYYDDKGKKDDFKMAVDKYSIEIDDSMSSYFNTLWMVLEYEDQQFKYLIEVSVNRSHLVNAYPIEIIVSGLLKEFDERAYKTQTELKQKMSQLFQSQHDYDQFINSKKEFFNGFLSSIGFELKKHMRIDDIKTISRARMVIHRDKQKVPEESVNPEYGGAPYGYFGFGDLLLYSFLWSNLCFDHHIHVSGTEMISESGNVIGDIGETGIDAVEGSVFDSNADIEEVGSSSGFLLTEEAVDIQDIPSGEGVAESISEVDSGSWFDSLFDGFDFDGFDI
jgi:hypothetical protein